MSVSDPPRTSTAPSGDQPRARRVSRRRYMVRRVVALGIVVVLVGGLVWSLAALLGDGADDGDDDVAAVSTPTSSPASPTATAPPAADAAAAPVAEPVEEPVTTEVPDAADDSDAPPSQSNPAQVYIVGDSDAGTFGPYLQRLLDGTLIVDTELNYKVSSGLARPDFFDWPAELATVLPEVDPDIVVVTFGGNDGQPLTEIGGNSITGLPEDDTADWTEEYERRAGAVMDLLLEDDRTVIWVGIPNDDNPEVTARMAIQDEAAKAAAAERPDVIFVDTWTRFSGRDGGWAEFVIDPRDGQGKDVRASDGFHLNEVGAEILALDIAQAVRDDLRARGANI